MFKKNKEQTIKELNEQINNASWIKKELKNVALAREKHLFEKATTKEEAFRAGYDKKKDCECNVLEGIIDAPQLKSFLNYVLQANCPFAKAADLWDVSDGDGPYCHRRLILDYVQLINKQLEG